MRLRTLLLAGVAAVLPLQIGCDLETLADSGGGRFKEDFEHRYDLRAGGRVSLETFNGEVEVMGWERPEVQITGTKYANREEDLRDIRIDIQAGADAVRIRAIRPEGRRGNMGAKFFLRVPREVELERIATSNGALRVEDIRGNGRLETSNGALRVRKLDGRLTARTSNGQIEIYGADGDLQLRTSNGAIRVESSHASLDAETSNGGINLQGFEPAEGGSVRLSTSNGSIEAAFERLDGTGVRASTSNASITVRLPVDTKARVRAITSNSSVNTDFEVAGTLGKHSIEGDINGGGPLLHLTSSNGSIRVLRM